MITITQVEAWIENPDIEQGAESDYWREMLKDEPLAKQNPQYVRAFLWVRNYIKSLTQ